MARRASKGPYTVYSDRDTAFINTTIGGRRVRESLGVPYPASGRRSAGHERAAQKAAAERYAELVAGRVLDAKRVPRIRTAHTLEELVAMWLAEMRALYPRSIRTLVTYGRHFLAFAEAGTDARTPLERLVDDEGPQRYAMARIRQTIRGTVRKELSNLHAFLDWAKMRDHLTSVPPRAKLPKGMKGVRSGPQRAKPVPITPEEARRIVAALPAWAARGGRTGDRSKVRGAFPVRDRFIFAYETGLRPGALDRLEAPRHWAPGARELLITEDIDKASYGRTVPLSGAAVAVLERCAPERGPIFGKHDYRGHIKAAALKVLPPDKARAFAAYDFRHGRTTHALDATGDLLGVAHLVGHKQVTTTNRYVHTSERHARNVLETESAMVSKPSATECEGRDLNPHESYPASTSRQRERGKDKAFSDPVRQDASENAGETTGGDAEMSASRQQLAESLGALAIQDAVWDAFDAFTAGAEGEP